MRHSEEPVKCFKCERNNLGSHFRKSMSTVKTRRPEGLWYNCEVRKYKNATWNFSYARFKLTQQQWPQHTDSHLHMVSPYNSKLTLGSLSHGSVCVLRQLRLVVIALVTIDLNYCQEKQVTSKHILSSINFYFLFIK